MEKQALTFAQESVMEEVPVSYRGVFLRAFTGKSKASALKAFCLSCVGYKRVDVAKCAAYTCPLHQYRPYQSGDDDGHE